MSPLLIIITSASVGALISTSITLLGQYFERKSRRKELLLSKAIEMGLSKTEFAAKVAKDFHKTIILTDAVILAAAYYKELSVLLKTENLSKDFQERSRKNIEKIISESTEGI